MEKGLTLRKTEVERARVLAEIHPSGLTVAEGAEVLHLSESQVSFGLQGPSPDELGCP